MIDSDSPWKTLPVPVVPDVAAIICARNHGSYRNQVTYVSRKCFIECSDLDFQVFFFFYLKLINL